MRIALAAAIALAASAPAAFAQAPAAQAAQAAPRPATRATLARRIDAVLDRPALAPATWGVEVREIATGRVLYARNAGKNMKPASTLKVVTTAATSRTPGSSPSGAPSTWPARSSRWRAPGRARTSSARSRTTPSWRGCSTR